MQLRYVFQTTPSPAGAIQYGNNPEAGHYADAGDAKIYYELYGQGEPLVVLQAMSARLTKWQDLLMNCQVLTK